MAPAPKRRHWWGWLLGAAVAAVAAFLFIRWEHGSAEPKPAPPKVPVTVATVSSGNVPIELEAVGRVTAYNQVTVRTQVAGQIKSIAFRDGQDVKSGAVLAQIDPRPAQAAVDQDRAVVERDRASLANAEADLKRYLPLVPAGVVSVQQVQTQRSLVAQLRGTVAGDLAALDRDQVLLGYATVRAPMAGTLGLKLVDVGNLVSPSDPAGIVVLTQTEPIAVLFALPQDNLAEIKARQSAATAGLAVQAWTQDGSRQLDQGSLEALNNQVDAASGTVTLKGVFSNAKRSLWPGAAVSVRLVLDTQHDALTVPSAAIDQGPRGPFVWVVGPDSTVKSTPVKLQQQAGGRALVSSGLQAGQKVVTNGQYGLTSGAHVDVQSSDREEVAGNSPAAPLRTNQPNRLGISP